jgi:hypothetical protein
MKSPLIPNTVSQKKAKKAYQVLSLGSLIVKSTLKTSTFAISQNGRKKKNKDNEE